MPSGIGLRFSRRSRRPQTPRPNTTIWRIYARRRSAGKIMRAYRTKAIAAQDSAARRVARATAFLRLHKWDAAYADMAKANKMDATDSEVKEWLPQFERLQAFLPQIKALDAQIAKSPKDAGLLLERARIFTLAGRPLLALDDAQRALKLQPASMRARIQTAEALLDWSPGRCSKIASERQTYSWTRTNMLATDPS